MCPQPPRKENESLVAESKSSKNLLEALAKWRSTKSMINILRKINQGQILSNKANVIDSACKADFINSLSKFLLDGKVVSFEEAEDVYKEICMANGMENEHIMKGRAIKRFIEERALGYGHAIYKPHSKESTTMHNFKNYNRCWSN